MHESSSSYQTNISRNTLFLINESIISLVRMNKVVLALAAGSVFTGVWAMHSGKFLGLPKIDKKKGLVASAILGGLAIFDFIRDRKKHHSVISGISHNPPIIPKAMSSFDKTSAYPSRQPIGSLTGIGREWTERGLPSSAIPNFPYSTLRE